MNFPSRLRQIFIYITLSFLLIGCSEEKEQSSSSSVPVHREIYYPEIGVVDDNYNPVGDDFLAAKDSEQKNEDTQEVIDISAYINNINSENQEAVVIEETLDETDENQHIIPEETVEGLGELKIIFMNVGQADSILITCNGESMLIDAGKDVDTDFKSSGTLIRKNIMDEGVSELKYVVATHPDADHIGWLNVINEHFKIESFLMTNRDGETSTYNNLLDSLRYTGTNVVNPNVGDNYSLGNALFTVLGPYSIIDNDNNSSIVIKLTFGNNSFLFMGDAEEDEERSIINSGRNISADVIKIGHHGSRSSSHYNFIQAVNPKYAVISCGEGNSYGHPHAETLNTLRYLGVNTFRTDSDGTIVCTSDGDNIYFNMSPSNNWVAGESTQNSVVNTQSDQANIIIPANSIENKDNNTGSEDTGEYRFIGNAKNHKLHGIGKCSSPPSAKVEYFYTVEEAIAAGYLEENFCKNCVKNGAFN